MTTLFVVVEGQTEEAFVKAVLAPHLANFGVWTTPIIVATRRDRAGRKRRGGGDWSKWAGDVRKLLRDPRPSLRVSTLFDLYGLPKNFPELDKHSAQGDTALRCEALEAAMAAEVDDRRFIPYLQRHEFEALVLAGLRDHLRPLLSDPADVKACDALVAALGDTQPEDVNDGVNTAPSKRLAQIPSYAPAAEGGLGKPFYGELVTVEAGLPTLRERCPRFSAWVATLEALGAPSDQPQG